MRILQSCGYISTTVWLYHTAVLIHPQLGEVLGENAGWKLYKNIMSCFKQILETAAIWPLASYLTKHSRLRRYDGHGWSSKDKLISDILLCTPKHRCANIGRPARTYVHQLCVNTGWMQSTDDTRSDRW